jgi:hypothetical protein
MRDTSTCGIQAMRLMSGVSARTGLPIKRSGRGCDRSGASKMLPTVVAIISRLRKYCSRSSAKPVASTTNRYRVSSIRILEK